MVFCEWIKPILLLALIAAAGTAATPDPLYKSLREAVIADVFVADKIALSRDVGVLTLKTGIIGFTAPVNGRDTVAVFLGDGEFTLNPATTLERNHLKGLTGQDSVKETFDRAIFCFTDDTGKEIRGQARTKATDAKLADILRDFRKRLRQPEAESNIDAEILADLYYPQQLGFFSAYLHGRKHDDLRFHVKPRGAIPELSPEEVYLNSIMPKGIPDESWYLTHLKGELDARTASSMEDKRAIAAESYKISTVIAKNDHFDASTTLKLRALHDGDRVIPLALTPTLRVLRVLIGGQELPFIQEDKKADAAFYVILPQPLKKGLSIELQIDYQGDKVVRKAGGGNFSVGARESWYPNVNSFKDHAQYDLTFRIPKQYTLVSVGKLEKEWTEKDFAASHWISEVPMAVAGFNYGTFKKKSVTDAQSGMIIEAFANPEVPDYLQGATSFGSTPSPAVLMDRTLADAQNALRVLTPWFGKLEFGRIALTQQPDFNFGQSWPSLVYLPLSAYLDSTQRWQMVGIQNHLTEFVDEVTPHEVSHQWWGHMVGWASYHDQWLSEGFADFSAGLFLQYTEKNLDKYLKYWSHGRDRLLEKNEYGRRPNDAGPVWMGLRLISEKNPAYNTVVYKKGGYVLHMLRMLMWDGKEGDKYFKEMMHDFVEQHLNKNASTESFQQIVEKHMRPVMNVAGNGKMDWFFNEWVYGTAIPKYKLDYTLTPADGGKVILKGSLTQSEVSQTFVMLVPLYLDFDGKVARLGQVRLAGNSSAPFEVELPMKPKRVMINHLNDVLEQQ